ncbi:MAG: hypothetical protein AB7P34_10385 [Vicinamibacterales bacterium]
MVRHDPNRVRQDRTVEEPGDTNAADIVGRTGEEMPRQSHDGLESEDRGRSAAESDEQDDEVDGYPV